MVWYNSAHESEPCGSMRSSGMNVEYAILAEAVDVSPSGKYSLLGGGVETFTPTAYPFTVLVLYLIVRMQFTLEETEHRHFLLVELHDPQGNNLLSTVQPREIHVDSQQAVTLDLPIAYLFVAALPNLTFSVPGKYVFRILVDDNELKTIPIACLQPPQQQSTNTKEVHDGESST